MCGRGIIVSDCAYLRNKAVNYLLKKYLKPRNDALYPDLDSTQPAHNVGKMAFRLRADGGPLLDVYWVISRVISGLSCQTHEIWHLSQCRAMKALASQSIRCSHTQSMDIDEDSGQNLDR